MLFNGCYYDTVNLNNNNINMNDVINDFETFFVKLSHFDDMAASPPPDTETISSAFEALNWTCKVISAKPKRFLAKMA